MNLSLISIIPCIFFLFFFNFLPLWLTDSPSVQLVNKECFDWAIRVCWFRRLLRWLVVLTGLLFSQEDVVISASKMRRITWCLIFITPAQPCRFTWIMFIDCPLLSAIAQWSKARFSWKTTQLPVSPVSFCLLSYPYSEDSNEGKQYMNTRCPAWCDRILLSTSARDLVLKVSHS